MAEIAFIGLGVMGGAMARHLVDKGHDVAVYDIAPGARDGFRNLKCRVAESPADAAAGARVLMTMLPEGTHVRSVLFGEDGAARTLAANALVIDTTKGE